MPCQDPRTILVVLVSLLISPAALGGGETTQRKTSATSHGPSGQTVAAVIESTPETDALRRELRQKVNRNTVELITSGVSGTHSRVAEDLAQVLNDQALRVLPVVGRSALDNITDLLYLRGIDMAILQTDDLEFARQQKRFIELRDHIHYVTKLFNEEIHLLAGENVQDLASLAGRRVNLGPLESATAITTGAVLEILGVPIQATHFPHQEALTRLRAGEIAALAYVTGKPAPLFQTLGDDPALHFVPIAYDAGLLENYLPARLETGDYPRLIAAGASVETVAVGTVLVAYRWPVENQRSRELESFVARLFDQIDTFRRPPYHPKWQEVSLSAVLPGWPRHPAAHHWLEQAQR